MNRKYVITQMVRPIIRIRLSSSEKAMAQNWRKIGAIMRLQWRWKSAMLISSQIGNGQARSRLWNRQVPRAAFLFARILREGGIGMVNRLDKENRLVTAYWTMVGIASSVMVAMQPVMADTIWDRFSTIMKDVYGKLVAISTIVAVTVAAIALIVRMVSRNQRAVDEATSWLKRIVITWIVLNSLGFVVAYLQPLVAGGQYNG